MRASNAISNKLVKLKIKYGVKVITQQGQLNTLGSITDNFDQFNFLSDFTISDTLFSSLVSSFLLGIGLNEIIPDNLNFVVQLPDFQQILNGLLLQFNQVDLASIVNSYLLEYQNIFQLIDLNQINITLTYPSNLLNSNLQTNVQNSTLSKAYYNQSYYDLSYYDPTAVRNFFKSTLYAIMKKGGTYNKAKAESEATAKSLNISPNLAETLFNRLSSSTAVKEQALTWDYGWWDKTFWSAESPLGEHEGQITYTDYNLQPLTQPYNNMIDLQAGGFWDNAFWDFFFWTEGYPQSQYVYKVNGLTVAIIHDAIIDNFRKTMDLTPIALANYQKPTEMDNLYDNPRIHIYGLSVAQVETLAKLTGDIVHKLIGTIDPLTLRLYKSSVLELYGILYNPHKWGREMQRTMNQEQLKNWWIKKWVGMGLNENVLSTLYDKMINTVKAFGNTRQKQRLKYLKYKIFG